jgi:dsDNA-specific endonuclease/ATPase MutS2
MTNIKDCFIARSESLELNEKAVAGNEIRKKKLDRKAQMRRRLLELVAENPGLNAIQLSEIGCVTTRVDWLARMHGTFLDAENDGDIVLRSAGNPRIEKQMPSSFKSGWFITDQGAWHISIMSN